MFDDHEDGAFMPQFDCPEGWDETSLFLKKVEEGLERRYNGKPSLEVLRQADYECGVICQMQFCGYFLVVADYINWAKAHGVMVGPGRGSAAGAMVAYAMGITELDPLEHGLIFERFLNPERVSLPDIDVDFDPDGRGRVLDYVGEKYGRDKVAQCVIYGTIKTKQALKDSARIMGYDFSVGDQDHQSPASRTDRRQGHSAARHLRPKRETIRGSTRIPRTVRFRPGRETASRTRRWASKV